MSLTINTNIAAMNAQRNLGKTQGALNKSLQRLSSGLRINSAKDDAAGLAISNRMASQVRGLNQAVRNANDAISLTQTAEGALQESTSILQRMRELSVQSANDTNTASDRSSMQAEISQLLEELDRIAETTQFNGKNLLDGTMIDSTFHVGANAGENQRISFDISSAQTEELSSVGTMISAPSGTAVSGTNVTGAILADTLTVNGNDVAAANGTAVDIAAAINTANGTNIATAVNSQTFAFEDMTLESGVAGVGTDGALTTGSAAVTESNTVVITDLANGETFTLGGRTVLASGAAVTADIKAALISGAASGTNFTISVDDAGINANWIITDEAGTFTYTSANPGTDETDLASTGSESAKAVVTKVADGAAAVAGAMDITGVTDDLAATVDGATFTLGGVVVDTSGIDFSTVTTGAELATALSTITDLTATYAGTTLSLATAAGTVLGDPGDALTDADGTITGSYTLTVDTVDVSVDDTSDAVVTAQNVVDALDTAGYTASVDADNNITIANSGGAVMNLKEEETGTNTGAGFADTAASAAGVNHQGQISLDSTSDITFTGTGLSNAGLGDVGNATTTINLVDISTRAGATTAITSIDSALTQMDEMRGKMGAIQNRFESTISNLQNVSENISAARSRIVDADFAAETAALTKSQILQQAGVAMLAQANQLPQTVLTLLQ